MNELSEEDRQAVAALSGRVRVTTVARRIRGQWRRVHHHEGVVPEGRPGT